MKILVAFGAGGLLLRHGPGTGLVLRSPSEIGDVRAALNFAPLPVVDLQAM